MSELWRSEFARTSGLTVLGAVLAYLAARSRTKAETDQIRVSTAGSISTQITEAAGGLVERYRQAFDDLDARLKAAEERAAKAEKAEREALKRIAALEKQVEDLIERLAAKGDEQ